MFSDNWTSAVEYVSNNEVLIRKSSNRSGIILPDQLQYWGYSLKSELTKAESKLNLAGLTPPPQIAIVRAL